MIDTHQHLILPDLFDYAWTKDYPQLHGRFGLEEYRAAAANTGIQGTLFMEADVDEAQSGKEARFICRMAKDPENGILGVVAAGRPEKEGFDEYLDSIAHQKLRGIRRVLHTQPTQLSTTSLFRENVARLAQRQLTFDLCVNQHQLGLALELVRACPATSFILDHCGVPDIATNAAPDGKGFLAWEKAIYQMAAELNVSAKLSGIPTYADECQRTPAGLQPYVHVLLDAFSPARIVWGGDWPVVNLGAGLFRWSEITRELLIGLSATERKDVLESNARRIYSL